MLRIIGAVIAGAIAWVLITTGAGLIVRASWPAYVAVSESMAFTLPMLFTRLAIGAVALLFAGWLAVLIGRRFSAAIALGAVMLIGFIPVHIGLWDKFPVWYHLLFLLTLVPLAMLGGRIGNSRRTLVPEGA